MDDVPLGPEIILVCPISCPAPAGGPGTTDVDTVRMQQIKLIDCSNGELVSVGSGKRALFRGVGAGMRLFALARGDLLEAKRQSFRLTA